MPCACEPAGVRQVFYLLRTARKKLLGTLFIIDEMLVTVTV